MRLPIVVLTTLLLGACGQTRTVNEGLQYPQGIENSCNQISNKKYAQLCKEASVEYESRPPVKVPSTYYCGQGCRELEVNIMLETFDRKYNPTSVVH